MKHRVIFTTLILSTFFWGANFNLGKSVVQATDPLTAAAWRFMLAGAAMTVYMLFTEGVNWRGLRQNAVALVAMAAIGIFGFNISFFFGLQTTSSVNGSLIMTLNPTITVILTALVISEAISWKQMLGLALSFCGVVTVVTGGNPAALLRFHFAIGDALILLGNLCWAAYSVIGKKWVRNLSAVQTTTSTMLIGALAMVAIALFQHGGSLPVPSTHTFGAIAIMALFGTVLAYLWWNNGIRTIGPARTAVFFDLVPIFTMLIAISLGEQVSPAQYVGAVLVISGVLFSSGALDMWLSRARPTGQPCQTPAR
ncbi:MAG TPA: EamA family transporter [Burkholderiaceae bacterium]|nr:EamA family transporter [Burkholderiaceae bacterium]